MKPEDYSLSVRDVYNKYRNVPIKQGSLDAMLEKIVNEIEYILNRLDSLEQEFLDRGY